MLLKFKNYNKINILANIKINNFIDIICYL